VLIQNFRIYNFLGSPNAPEGRKVQPSSDIKRSISSENRGSGRPADPVLHREQRFKINTAKPVAVNTYT